MQRAVAKVSEWYPIVERRDEEQEFATMTAAHKYNLQMMEHIKELDRQKASQVYRESVEHLDKQASTVHPIHLGKGGGGQQQPAAAAVARAETAGEQAVGTKRDGPNALQKMMDKNARQRAALLGNI